MTDQGMHEELREGRGDNESTTHATDQPVAESMPAGGESEIDVVLVTGLSGAGRGTAAKVLEDLGWYVADNLPPELIGRLIELGAAADPPITKLALVMDVRSRFFKIGRAHV